MSAVEDGSGTVVLFQSPVRHWCFIPVGTDELSITKKNVVFRKRRCAACISSDVSVERHNIMTSSIVLSSPFGSWPTILAMFPLTIIAAFFGGFLLHLIPSEIYGVSKVLGSSSMHKKFGIVWGALFVFCLILFWGCLRQRVLRVYMLINDQYSSFDFTLCSKEMGEHIDNLLRSESNEKVVDKVEAISQTGILTSTFTAKLWPVIVGWSIFVALLINMCIAIYLVLDCKNDGGCAY